MRARSIVETSTDHICDVLTADAAIATGGTVWSPRPQWKARCYAFRAFPPRGGVVFGGPLLGGSDRHRTAASGPAGVCRRAADASLSMRSTSGTRCPSPSRCALRAPMRARAHADPLPCDRPAPAARLHRTRATPPARRHSRSPRSRVSRHGYQAKQATWDVSTTSWDVSNVPKRPQPVPGGPHRSL
jgi:hypothetical protein